MLMPGETAAANTPAGKTGTPTAQTAGTAFTITVNAVDDNWNVVSTNDTVAITSSDANATLPANAALVNGTKTFSVTLKTSGSQTVTASDVTQGGIMPDTGFGHHGQRGGRGQAGPCGATFSDGAGWGGVCPAASCADSGHLRQCAEQ